MKKKNKLYNANLISCELQISVCKTFWLKFHENPQLGFGNLKF